jgi:hypothetical protein
VALDLMGVKPAVVDPYPKWSEAAGAETHSGAKAAGSAAEAGVGAGLQRGKPPVSRPELAPAADPLNGRTRAQVRRRRRERGNQAVSGRSERTAGMAQWSAAAPAA